MSLPVDFNTTRVYGKYVNLNGSPGVGTVSFSASLAKALRSDTYKTAIIPVNIQVTLDPNGEFEIDLPATNDPDIEPTGFTYQVDLRIGQYSDSFVIAVPLGPDIDLTEPPIVAPVTAMAQYVRRVNNIDPDVNGNITVPGIDPTAFVTKHSLVRNVKDHGAVGDGVTNDTVAIQAAIDAVYAAGGGTVWLPRGSTFVVVPALHGRALTARPNVTITGGGTLKVPNANPKYITIIGHEFADSVSGFKLVDIQVDQNGPNNGISAIVTDEYMFVLRVFRGSGIEVTRCTFTNLDSINTLVFNGDTTAGIFNVSNVLVAHNLFTSVGGAVAHDHSTIYTNADNVRVIGNQFKGRIITGACAPSAVCAIELHGNQIVAQGNTIQNFRDGINGTAAAFSTQGSAILGNTIYRAMRGISLYSQTADSGVEPAVSGSVCNGNSIMLDPDFWAATWVVTCRGISFISTSNNATRGLTISGNVIQCAPYTGSNTTVASLNSAGIMYLRTGSTSNVDREIQIIGNNVSGMPGPGIAAIGAVVRGLSIQTNVISDCGHTAITVAEYRTGVYVSGDARFTTVAENTIYDTRTNGPQNRGVTWLCDSTATEGRITGNRVTLTNTSDARQIQLGASSGAPLVQHSCTGGTNTAAPAPTGGVEVGSTWIIRASGSRTTQTAFPAGTTWA